MEENNNQQETKALDVKGNKISLAAFILAVLSVECSASYYVAIIGLGCGIASLILLSEPVEPDRNPFKVFNKISKILSIVGICIGGTICAIYLVVKLLNIYNH